MATIMLSRGRTETVLSLSAPGGPTNDYRIPQDIQGARIAWQNIVTGGTVNNVTLEASLDGVSWSTFDTSTVFATNEVRVLPVEGVMGIRARWNSTTGGTQVTVLVRCA